MASKISKIAIKKPSGKVVTAPIGKAHKDLHTQGKRGFVTDSGKFVGRTEGAKIAKSAHQASPKVSSLHSHHLTQRSKTK